MMTQKQQKIKNHSNTRPVGGEKTNVDPLDVHVGHKIRQRRRQLGYSSHQLAQALHLNVDELQCYEQGKASINARLLHRTAGYLDIHINYFFDGLPEPVEPETNLSKDTAHNVVALTAPATLMVDDPRAIALMRAFLGISDQNLQNSLLSLVHDLHPEDQELGCHRLHLVN